ncbi:AAA family ATPase [Gordonia sputi]
MRLHRLRMSAFGPFADDTAIDFDALGADGLFLLHGQTGAGKTTVLDAVAFALFGRVPGARNEAKRLHSDHAPAEQVPQVEVEATINGRRFRIIRSPWYQRPKKRGTGTTKVQAKATLEWVDGSGVALTRLPEIGETVSELLGMSAEQFFQVVLLPQGDFSRFLRAPNEEREALLERLFDTERFGDVEEWLRERARESAAALDAKAASIDRIAAQIGALADVEAPIEPDMAWAQKCLDDAREAERRDATALAEARDVLDAAQQSYDRGRKMMHDRQRGLAARSRIEQLDAAEPELDVAEKALAAARRAAPVVPVLADHEQAIANARAADALRAAAESAVSEHAVSEEVEAAWARECDDTELARAIDTWAAESGRLEPLVRRTLERPTLIAAIGAAEAEVSAAATRTVELDDALAALPEQRTAAIAALHDAHEQRARIETLRNQQAQQTSILEAIDERDKLEVVLSRAERAVADAHSAHNDARTRLLDLRERRLAGMAAELASQLVDGEPCTVCGSREHPAPTTSDPGDHVGDADEAAAADIEHRASAELTRARSSLDTYRERKANLDKMIGDAERESVCSDRDDTVKRRTKAEHAAASVDKLQRVVDELDGRTSTWQAERSQIQARRAAASVRLDSLRGELESLDAEVSTATGGRGDVSGRRAELAELCRCATALRDARAEVRRAGEWATQAASRAASACDEAQFADETAVRAAMATDEQMGVWESSLRKAHGLRVEAQGTLDDDDVRSALATEPVGLAHLETTLETVRARCDAASGAAAVSTRRATGLADHVTLYWEALTDFEPIRLRQKEIHDLAELVSGRGQNAKRMTLRSYVLAARLEEVLVAASDRLRHMSSGRYEFAHSDAGGPRGRRGGLGIEVRDEYTGVTRAATTLSGGETFFASLALALGLADVVSSEAAGRVLDTMFIDEGFGTLDPESLDLVMGVLDELRSGGRVVGLVSHVDELRARIPSQLHVLRGESGSTVTVRTLTAP